MINIICLKWGTYYDASWANRLYLMVKHRCSVPFKFYCVTDDTTNLHKDINTIPIPQKEYDLETYWWKCWMLSEEFPAKGKNLYFDLDTVIQNDIRPICELPTDNKLLILATKWRELNNKKYNPATGERKKTNTNSSVMLWNTSESSPNTIWKTFIDNSDYYMLKHVGNDDFFENELSHVVGVLPHKWFYARMWGYDDTIPQIPEWRSEPFIDAWGYDWPLYHIPERLVCILNGTRYSEGFDMRVWDGLKIYYEGLE